MKHKYKLLYIALFAVAGFLSTDAVAQDFTVCSESEAECVVEYHNGDFVPYNNALRNTIANDTLNGGRKHPDRVYVLETGGTYFTVDPIVNSGFHLRLRSQTEAEVGAENYFGPARIQIKTDETGGTEGRLMTVQGDLTVDGVFFTGRHDGGGTGNYLPIRISADGARIIVKNSIFEQSDFSLFGFDSQNNKVYIYDSVFRNQINRTQQWEGRGIRFEAGADTLIIENSTYLNIGMTILQSEAAPINYTRFVHNTVINVGRLFNAGNFWKEGYVANNLFVNHYWHGEGDADDINDDTREFPFTGFFAIGPVGPGAGFTDAGRRVVYANNAHWRDPQFATYYADTINAQPLFNSEADSMFNTLSVEAGGSFYRANNWEETDPNIAVYYTAPDLGSDFPATEVALEDIVPDMIANIRDLRESRQSPFTYWGWDPGRDPDPASFSIQSVQPEYLNPGDFSYDESTYLTAGTDGLPLGNLNYHGEARTSWDANKATYVDAIEALAGEVVVIDDVLDGAYEAEWGTPSNGAETSSYDGFVEFLIEGSGYVEWKFTLDAPADVDSISLEVRSNDGVRGANIFLNDGTNNTQLSNDVTGNSFGEIRFYNLGGNVYPEEGNVIAVDTMNAASQTALTGLQAGVEYTVRWEPGWGYYTFAGLVFYSEGDTLVDMSGSKASDFAQVVPSAGADATGWVPSLLRSVALGSGGTVTFSLDNDGEGFEAGDYFAEIYYENSGAANMPSITANGKAVGTIDNAGFEESADMTTSLTTHHFQLTSKGNIDLAISGDDARIDYIILYSQQGGVITDIEQEDMVDRFALSQNYPNPFNPSTNINFTLPAASNATLSIYNLLGQKVATLIDGRLSAGAHSVQFNARNLASGVYFYQLKAGDLTLQKRMTLIK